MKSYLSVALLALAMVIGTLSQAASDDQIKSVIPHYDHKIYSGYFDLSIFEKKSVHYVFYPSQSDKNSDPLVIWFTGGPGCSSLLAAFHEIGPFVFPPGKLAFQPNPWSWNTISNLLFLEMPLGVGFSQTDQTETTITDETFAKDAFNVLGMFYARFPGLKQSEVYLSGHGYASVYITYLSRLIIEQNSHQKTFSDKINLKGLLLGNPCVRPDECFASGSQKKSQYHYQYLYHRAFYSDRKYSEYISDCLVNYDSQQCYTRRIQMDELFNATKTSPYNIYDKCWKDKNDTIIKYVNTGCQDTAGIMNFMNDPIVKNNWNIRDSAPEWQPCNKRVFHQYHGDSRNMYWALPQLINHNLRIMIYSGDLDSTVPITGTKLWLQRLKDQLNMPVKKVWREWWVHGLHSGEDQVGGFVWELRDLTFATVKGAGFRTGYDKPQAIYHILESFIFNEPLPKKNKK